MKRIPNSFDEFTVLQFQQWHKICKQKFEDVIDREFALLSIFVDKPESLPQGKSLPMIAKLNTLSNSKPSDKIRNVIRVNGKIYQAILKPSELKSLLSTSQATAFKEYTKNDCIENMHLVLPLLFCPYQFFRKKKLSEDQLGLAEEFKTAKIKDVYGVVFFYTIVSQKLIEASLPYLKSATETIREHLEEVQKAFGQGSENHTVGTT